MRSKQAAHESAHQRQWERDSAGGDGDPAAPPEAAQRPYQRQERDAARRPHERQVHQQHSSSREGGPSECPRAAASALWQRPQIPRCSLRPVSARSDSAVLAYYSSSSRPPGRGNPAIQIDGTTAQVNAPVIPVAARQRLQCVTFTGRNSGFASRSRGLLTPKRNTGADAAGDC